MKFARIGAPGAERPAASRDGERWHDLSRLTREIDGAFLSQELAALDLDGLLDGLPEVTPARFGPPIARPGKVVGIGLNYTSYARAAGAQPPAEPIVFLKASSAVCGPTDDIRPLPGSATTDYEVELGVVIGRELAGAVTAEQSGAAIAGYLLANDITDRGQVGSSGPWARGKCADTFLPIGPWLATPDEVEDPSRIRLELAVNGEPRQDGSTADMIFDVPTILTRLAALMTLEPGDLVITGTPTGVAVTRPDPQPYLQPGDLLEVSATGLGTHRSPVSEDTTR